MVNFRERRRGGGFSLQPARFIQLSPKFQDLGFQVLELNSVVGPILLRVLKVYREFFGLLPVLGGRFLIRVALRKQRTIILGYSREKTIPFLSFDDISNRSLKFSEVPDFQRDGVIFLRTRV